MKREFEIEEHRVPECWVPYLINQDHSGLSAEEKAGAETFLARVALGSTSLREPDARDPRGAKEES